MMEIKRARKDVALGYLFMGGFQSNLMVSATVPNGSWSRSKREEDALSPLKLSCPKVSRSNRWRETRGKWSSPEWAAAHSGVQGLMTSAKMSGMGLGLLFTWNNGTALHEVCGNDDLVNVFGEIVEVYREIGIAGIVVFAYSIDDLEWRFV